MKPPRVMVRHLGCALAAGLLLAALTPGAAPAAGTLVHWYKADGDATDSVAGADASNGVLLGDTAFGAGMLGQAFVVDGADDYVSIPPNASFYPSGSFTVDAWAATTTPVQQGTLVPGQIAVLYECANFCPSGVANAVWEIEIRDGRAFGFVRDDDSNGPGGNGQVITGGPLLNDGAFHRVTLVRDVEAHVLALYADGIEVAEAPLNAGADSALTNTDGEADPITIGAQFEGGTSTPIEDFAGSIDEVRYLTGTEYPDTTPPVIAAVVSGTAGGDGWYTGDVSVTWTISDESITRSTTGCGSTTLTSDTSAATLSCQASSAGGSSTGSVTVKRDATPPTVTCRAAPKFAIGATGTVTASVADAGSGAASANVTAAAATQSAGTKTASVTGRDVAGNATTVACPYTVDAPKPATTSVAITQIATLPPPKACVSRRRFRIRLRNVKATKIVAAQIRLDRKIVRAIKGKALGLPIDLRGLPKGKFKVTITVTDSAGAKRVGSRTYRTCVPRRAST